MIEVTDPTSGAMRPVRVAGVLSSPDAAAIAPEVDLLVLEPGSWHDELEAFGPDLLLVHSVVDPASEEPALPLGGRVLAAVKWCRDRGIPTALWTLHGPRRVMDDVLLAAAVDRVFVADLDAVTALHASLGHDRIHLLPAGVQPRLHPPQDLPEPLPAASLAGTFDPRTPNGEDALHTVFEATVEHLPILVHDLAPARADGTSTFPEGLEYLLVPGDHDRAQLDRDFAMSLHVGACPQSQSALDPRVLELLAAGRPVVGPPSRPARLLLGDLTTSSGDRSRLVAAVGREAGGVDAGRAYLALRKVLTEHTVEHRLRRLLTHFLEVAPTPSLPQVTVVAAVGDAASLQRLATAITTQDLAPDAVDVVAPADLHDEVQQQLGGTTSLRTLTPDGQDPVRDGDRVALLDPRDHHSSSYLLDLALATRFAPGRSVGRAAHHVLDDQGAHLVAPQQQYRTVTDVPLRAALVATELVSEWSVQRLAGAADDTVPDPAGVVSIDAWSHARDVPDARVEDAAAAVAPPDLDLGVPLSRLEDAAARAVAEPVDDDARAPLRQLASWLPEVDHDDVDVRSVGGDLEVTSSSPTTTTAWSTRTINPTELVDEHGWVGIRVDVDPVGAVDLVLRFLDYGERTINRAIVDGNRTVAVDIPYGTEAVQVGVRVHLEGQASVGGLRVGGEQAAGPVVTTGSQLLVTNRYPSYDAPYNNMFVHKRVLGYRTRGVDTDVLRLGLGAPASYHEFEDVDCITGGRNVLQSLTASQDHASMAVHFLTPPLWPMVRDELDQRRVVTWVHGFEIQPWWRRDFNYDSEEEAAAAKEQTDRRMRMWREVFEDDRCELVFVSQYLADQAMQDVGIELPADRYRVIHNPIDTDLFAYHAKRPEQRFDLLSIRPFASATYANDLTVDALLELVDEPWFSQLNIRIIGKGRLFHDVTAPLRDFDNVVLEPRFLQQTEIAALHRQHGVFLCPSRMDSQGVSRDEAMASGLVPVTSDVAAVPEFVDESCGFLAPEDDHVAIADAIRSLVEDPDLFQRLSAEAAARVRRQSGQELVIDAELDVLRPR